MPKNLGTNPNVLPPETSAGDDHTQEHFQTDHLLSNLKRRTVSNGAITATAQLGKFCLSLVSTMILARLLNPADFGLVALVTTAANFFQAFKDAGLSLATVQRDKITHAQVSNLFWMNVVVSASCAMFLAALAPVLAWFYREPRLIGIALPLSATFLISGTAVQHQALLRRQMRFKAMAVIDLGSMAAGVLAGSLMAFWGFAYWSLVGSSLITETSALVLTWSISTWRPQLPTRRSGTGPLLSFGAARTAGTFIAMVTTRTDTLLVGRFYGAESVGLYTRAGALLINPLRTFMMPINSAITPTLSRLQSQPQRYRATFLRFFEVIVLGSFLFTGLLLPLAGPLTVVLLGPKWEQAASIFAGFALAAVGIPPAQAAAWLFTTQGEAGIY
jgi:PST family polysaccharide transporter